MRRAFLVVGLGLGLTLVSAPAALAADPFSDFQAVCVKTGGDHAAALAAADRLGWKVLPKTGSMSWLNVPMHAKAELRGQVEGPQRRVLLLDSGPAPLGRKSVEGQICQLTADNVDGVVEKLQTSLGVKPTVDELPPGPGPKAVRLATFMYRDTPKGRIPTIQTEITNAPLVGIVTQISVTQRFPVRFGSITQITYRP